MPTSKAVKVATFRVRGTGEFPTDMLQYDQCRAATPVDQQLIDAKYDDPETQSHLWDDQTKRLRINTVTLVTEQTELVRRGIIPTRDRWRSFLWTVVG